jgi:hypothetical protein
VAAALAGCGGGGGSATSSTARRPAPRTDPATVLSRASVPVLRELREDF